MWLFIKGKMWKSTFIYEYLGTCKDLGQELGDSFINNSGWSKIITQIKCIVFLENMYGLNCRHSSGS